MDSFDHELAKQRRDVHHLQLSGHGVQLGLEVERSNGDPAVHLDPDALAVRHPKRSVWRDNPGTELGLHAHHSRDGVYQLVPAGRREGSDGAADRMGHCVAPYLERVDELSHSRYLLSKDRRHASALVGHDYGSW